MMDFSAFSYRILQNSLQLQPFTKQDKQVPVGKMQSAILGYKWTSYKTQDSQLCRMLADRSPPTMIQWGLSCCTSQQELPKLCLKATDGPRHHRSTEGAPFLDNQQC